jgi:hypothetical protein
VTKDLRNYWSVSLIDKSTVLTIRSALGSSEEQDNPASSQKKIDLMELAHMGVYNYELGIDKM